MPAELYATGMKNITCVDFSQVLIHRMRDRWAHLHDLEFVVGDACSLPGCMTMQNGQHVGMASEDWTNCFGIVFDKAMLDAILCAGGTRDPLLRAQTAVREAWRVLKVSQNLILFGFIESPSLTESIMTPSVADSTFFAPMENQILDSRS